MSVSTEGSLDSFTPEDPQASSVVTAGLSGEKDHINRELPTATASSWTPGGDRNSQRLSHRGAAGQARVGSGNRRWQMPKRIGLLTAAGLPQEVDRRHIRPRPADGGRRAAAAVEMLLPPALYSRLAGAPVAAEALPVERSPAAGAAPFRFTPRPVRFPRDHEFFEDGDVQRHLYLQDVLTQVSETPEKSMVPEFTCQVAGCCQVFAALEDYQHHYHMLHENTCSLCSRAFPSGHLLDVHILEWHDSLFQILAQRQDMYQCLVEGCPEKFKTSQDRKDHMVRFHLYPADFRFDKPRTNRGPAMPAAADPPAGALKDDSDAMDICSEPAAPPPCRQTYSHRIPSTVCFGQGAARGFKSTKKRNKHH